MKIVFMGTPAFAVESLKILIENHFNIAAVITAPDRPAGRGKKLKSSAIKDFAVAQNLAILQPTNLKDPDFNAHLKSINADLFVVVAFRMLPKIVWSLPKYGTINLHASLLPNYRGAAPINWALINGEKKTGVTTFFIEEKIDTGEIINQKEIEILDHDNVGMLHDKLMKIGATVLKDTVKAISNQNYVALKQDSFKLSKINAAPKLNKQTGKINWANTTQSINNLIRGMSPYPGAWTIIEIDNNKLMLKIFSASISEKQLETGQISVNNDELYIGCLDGCIKLAEIQLEGKKRMHADQFLRGARITNLECT